MRSCSTWACPRSPAASVQSARRSCSSRARTKWYVTPCNVLCQLYTNTDDLAACVPVYVYTGSMYRRAVAGAHQHAPRSSVPSALGVVPEIGQARIDSVSGRSDSLGHEGLVTLPRAKRWSGRGRSHVRVQRRSRRRLLPGRHDHDVGARVIGVTVPLFAPRAREIAWAAENYSLRRLQSTGGKVSVLFQWRSMRERLISDVSML